LSPWVAIASIVISRPSWALASSSRTQWVCTMASWLRREAMRSWEAAIGSGRRQRGAAEVQPPSL